MTGSRRARLTVALTAAALACVVPLLFAAVAAAADLQPPATIKVARRMPANDPDGVIFRVDTVDFRTYCVRVLSHEWAPATAFSDEALKAGALAVKDYAWYWATRPTKLADVRAWGADVDDSTNYQVYMDTDYGPKYWGAVDAVSGQAMTRGGQIFQASYFAGSYNGAAGDGYHMTQWGTEYWADHGKDYQWIAGFYYPGIELTAVSGALPAGSSSAEASAATSGTSATTADALAADPSLRGEAKLELVGDVVITPDKPQQGDRVTVTFTLHNAGAQAGRWDALTVVGRGPGDEVRDFGIVSDLRMGPGDYRMFVAQRRVGLAGQWRGWLIVGRDQSISLVGDGAPFTVRVEANAQVAADGGVPVLDMAGESAVVPEIGLDPLSAPVPVPAGSAAP